MEKNTII